MNSAAVVIGAMLISPLMGPINGIGYSVATYNFPLFRKSLKNYGFAMSAALVTSTMYFMLTPIHTEHSELLSRTSPTIYDVLIGLFGGLAGIVAISSKNKGNVIPGVAIATALMPPLCTAGYGLAIGNWGYLFGALYLFVINSVFIALSAMTVSQILKLPKQTHLLSREIKNKNIAIGVAILLTVGPSFYLGYTLVQKEKFVERAEHFVKGVGLWEGNYLLDNTINADTKEVNLIYAGNEFDEDSENRLKKHANELNLGDALISIEQGIKIQDYESSLKGSDEFSQMTAEINRLKGTLIFKEKSIDSLKAIPELGKSLLKEIKPLFPMIQSCTYSSSKQYVDSTGSENPISFVNFSTSAAVHDTDQVRIYNWLKNRLKTDRVLLKF